MLQAFLHMLIKAFLPTCKTTEVQLCLLPLLCILQPQNELPRAKHTGLRFQEAELETTQYHCFCNLQELTHAGLCFQCTENV